MSDVRYVRPSGVSGSIAKDASPAARDDAENANEKPSLQYCLEI